MIGNVALKQSANQLFDDGQLHDTNTDVIYQNCHWAHHLPQLGPEYVVAYWRVIAVLWQVLGLQQHHRVELNYGYDYHEHEKTKHVPQLAYCVWQR